MTDNQMKSLISLLCTLIAVGLVFLIIRTGGGASVGIEISLTIILWFIAIFFIDRVYGKIAKQRTVLKNYDELTFEQKKDVIKLFGKDAEKILKTTKQKIIIKNGKVIGIVSRNKRTERIVQ